MDWLGLTAEQDPFCQTARFDRYEEVIQKFLSEGKAYRFHCTKEELEQLRADQMARKEMLRYDGRWRDRTDASDGVEPVPVQESAYQSGRYSGGSVDGNALVWMAMLQRVNRVGQPEHPHNIR